MALQERCNNTIHDLKSSVELLQSIPDQQEMFLWLDPRSSVVIHEYHQFRFLIVVLPVWWSHGTAILLFRQQARFSGHGRSYDTPEKWAGTVGSDTPPRGRTSQGAQKQYTLSQRDDPQSPNFLAHDANGDMV